MIAAASEYGATFRTDVETFISREVVDACTIPGRFELPRSIDKRHFYVGFTDPSGGSQDSFTRAVAHMEGKTAVKPHSDIYTELLPLLNGKRVELY